MQAHPRTVSYRPDIDGLRAVAVLGVILFHADQVVPGGYVGVDVFFVISGFLITSLIYRDLQKGTFSLSDFWERRIRRILPALATVMFFTTVAAWFVLVPADAASYGKSLVAVAAMMSNIHFSTERGYFHPASDEKPLLHTWSLSVEEQFYIIVPVVLLLLARKIRLERLLPVLAVAAVCSLALSVVATDRWPSASFYFLPTRAWELLAGSLVALLPDRFRSASQLSKELGATVGLCMIGLSYFLYDSSTSFPGIAAVVPVVGASLLIWSGTTPAASSDATVLPMMGRALAWRPLVFIGLVSYSLYLWHWPLFAFTRYLSVSPIAPTEWIALIGLSVVLAILSWRFVEVPFRRRDYFQPRRKVFATAVAVHCMVLGIGLTALLTGGIPSRLSPETLELAAAGRSMDFVHELQPEDIPENLIRIGDPHGPQIPLLVWGDSHAMAVLPVLDALCREQRVAMHAATRSATPPVTDFLLDRKGYDAHTAKLYNAAVMEHAKAAGFKAVLLVARWEAYFNDAQQQFEEALLSTVDELRGANIQVYILLEVPSFSFSVPKVLALYKHTGRDLSQLRLSCEEYRTMTSKQRGLAATLASRGARLLDPLAILSNGSGHILPYDAGGTIYRDTTHLTTYGAMKLRPLFVDTVRLLAEEGQLRHQQLSSSR